ncbi:hypothetical protein Peur_009674 [Populus x canadensis]
MEKKGISATLDKDTTLVALTKEAEEMSVAVFASLLSSISLTTKSKGSGSWSIVSELMKSKRVVDAKTLLLHKSKMYRKVWRHYIGVSRSRRGVGMCLQTTSENQSFSAEHSQSLVHK